MIQFPNGKSTVNGVINAWQNALWDCIRKSLERARKPSDVFGYGWVRKNLNTLAYTPRMKISRQ